MQPSSQPTWQTGVDSRFVARLLRHPGLIGIGLARRIVRGVEAMASGLPLLARFQHKIHELGGGREPIVHPNPIAPSVETIVVPAPVTVVSARVVERVETHERTVEKATPDVVRTERVVRESIAAPPAVVPLGQETPLRTPPVIGAPTTVEPAAPASRRTRVGAPILPEELAPVPPAPSKQAPTAPPPIIEHVPNPSVPHVAIARRVELGAPVVPIVTIARKQLPAERLIEFREAPAPLVTSRVVASPRALPVELAHVEAPAQARTSPAATASPTPTPAPSAVERSVPRAPSAPTQPVINLDQLAERVHGILERQALHNRARRGMR